MTVMTLPELLARNARKFPDKEAVVSEKGRWTFSQWEAEAARRATALAGLGIGFGDRVPTLFLNGMDALATYLAVLKLGAVLVPLNVRLSSKELDYILRDCGAKSLIFLPRFSETVADIRKRGARIENYIVCGKNDGSPGGACLDLDRLAAAAKPGVPENRSVEKDPACILYTSGTTGRPKGVLLSHGNCLWAAVSLAQDSRFETHHRVLLVFPLYHSAAFSLLNTCLYLGCTLVSMERFDSREVMELTVRERISKMAFPPTVWNLILQLPDLGKYDTSSVESVSSGAAAMPLETKQRLIRLFPQAQLGETYGMTETAAAITTLKPGDVMDRTGSVGRALTNTEVRVVDDNDRDLPPDQIGQVIVRGPNVMLGYLNRPRETEAALQGGWLHTGDMGRLDQDGFLYLVDRLDDMIISGGENIYPREVEEVLFTHPKIREAAVVGLPDPVWGQRVHAVVCLGKGEEITGEEVIRFCRERLAGYKKPRSVEFTDSLPRSAVGKVLKRLIRDKYRAV